LIPLSSVFFAFYNIITYEEFHTKVADTRPDGTTIAADCSINDGAGRNNHCPYYLLTVVKRELIEQMKDLRSKRTLLFMLTEEIFGERRLRFVGTTVPKFVVAIDQVRLFAQRTQFLSNVRKIRFNGDL
jgi:hypothetical protein